MNLRRSLLAPVVLFLLVGGAAGLPGGTAASAATVLSTAAIPIGGTVIGPSESISISGYVQVNSTMVTDPDFGAPPIVILTFDFTNVSGQGLKTGATYNTTSGDQNDMIRAFKSSELIQMTFPIWKSTVNFMSAKSGLASFTLNFDVVNGTLTGGSGSASTP